MIRGTVAYAKGRSHIRSGKSNEDSFCIMPLEDEGLYIAAVADGVGSCKHAEDASTIAAESVAHFLRENFPIVDASPLCIKSLLRLAMNKALNAIYCEAAKNKDPTMRDYQTTLMVVVYHYESRRTYFAHVGDGCIFILKRDGTFTPLTTRQQTSESYVIPLSAGVDFYEIAELTDDYASLVICTDGVADKIRNASVEGGIYVPLMMLFDPYVVQYLKRVNVNYSKLFAEPDSISRHIIHNAIYRALRKEYGFKKATTLNIVSSIKQGALIETLKSIQDDITAVCIYNAEILPKAREPKYYMEPDWKNIYAKRRKLLYPDVDTHTNEETAIVSNTPKGSVTPIRKIKLALGKLLKKVKKDA